MIKKYIFTGIQITWELLYLPVLMFFALASRYIKRKYDIGIGPEPLINNIYHKKSLQNFGYSCETFVNTTWHIAAEFDKIFEPNNKAEGYISLLLCGQFYYVIKNYKMVYIYFNGGPLYRTKILWLFEPKLLELANIKIVVMPYGGDVQHLNNTWNLYFKSCMIRDYPKTYQRHKRVKKQIEMWINSNAYILCGCDWVDYIYHWDKLMLSHFSIDTNSVKNNELDQNASKGGNYNKTRPMKILHAPNHREIKGTRHLINAVEDLKNNEELYIELHLIEKKSNDKVLDAIRQVDLVVDQLVIGWYAMFAIEAMALNKPVICFLREDLKNLYIASGLIKKDEVPLINSNCTSIKETLRMLYNESEILEEKGKKGRLYVEKHHSLNAIGKTFNEINKILGILPSGKNNVSNKI